MPVQESASKDPKTTRPERVVSHALVEVKRHLWWPFGVRSAVLLDVSQTGFKIEFTGNTSCTTGEKLLMEIPLAPFGVMAPKAIVMEIQVLWFDEQKMRCGGIFLNTTPTTVLFLQKIMEISKGTPI